MLSIIVQGMGLQYISASVSQMISGQPQYCLMHHACNAAGPVQSFHASTEIELILAAITIHINRNSLTEYCAM